MRNMATDGSSSGEALRGLVYAAAVWLANAFVVLPCLREGIANSRSHSLLSIAYVTAAHTVFFVGLAVLFARTLPAFYPAHPPRHWRRR